MSDAGEDVSPNNTRCPMCGAVDWYSDARYHVGLVAYRNDDNAPVIGNNDVPLAVPADIFICRTCRFIRLRSRGGTLEIA
jgi:hypothetical protein